MSYTKDMQTVKLTRDFLIFGSSWNVFLSLFPILFIGFFSPSNPLGGSIENFGLGSFTSKLIILIFASALLVAGALVRLISNIQVHPVNAPGVVDSKLVFYLTGFTLEIIVVYLYAVARIDLRYWVPNGSSQPGDYLKAKSGFKRPFEDEEALFQEVDFKMRFSTGEGLPRDSKPQGAWYYENASPRSARWRPPQGTRWQDVAVDRSNATREQVRQAIWDLRLNSEMVGQPVVVGNGEELLVYAFRCRRGSYSEVNEQRVGSGMVRTPGRTVPPHESWEAKSVRSKPEYMEDMI